MLLYSLGVDGMKETHKLFESCDTHNTECVSQHISEKAEPITVKHGITSSSNGNVFVQEILLVSEGAECHDVNTLLQPEADNVGYFIR